MPSGYAERYRDELRAVGGQLRDQDAQDVIVAAVCRGHVPSSVKGLWQPIETKSGPYRAIFHVGNDALKIGKDGDYVRPLVSHKTLQAAADVLGMVVPTKKILDATADQASMQIDAFGHLIPGKRTTGTKGIGQDFVRPESASGILPWSIAVMEEESERMDRMSQALVGIPEPPPFAGFNQVGKTWASAGMLHAPGGLPVGKRTGINHGFYNRVGKYGKNRTPGGWRIGQNLGPAHPVTHTDYSQRGILMHRTVWVTGGKFGDDKVALDVDQVATDPELGGLIWGPGEPFEKVRHPWLPFYRCGGGSKPGGSGSGDPDPDPGKLADPEQLPWGKADEVREKRERGTLLAWLGAAAAAAAAWMTAQT